MNKDNLRLQDPTPKILDETPLDRKRIHRRTVWVKRRLERAKRLNKRTEQNRDELKEFMFITEGL